jgi:glutaredoxin
MNKKQIEKRIQELYDEIRVLNSEKTVQEKASSFLCGKCNKQSRLGNCVYIHTYYWEDDPYNSRYKEGDEKGVWCPHCKAQNRFLSKKSVDKYVKPYEYRVRDIFADEVHVFDGGGFPAKYKLGEWEPWEEKSKAKDINNPFSCFVNL